MDCINRYSDTLPGWQKPRERSSWLSRNAKRRVQKKCSGILKGIAPNAISLSASTFLLSKDNGEGFPGNILFALDPGKVESVKAVATFTVTDAFGSSFGKDKDIAIKAMLDGV